MAAHDVFGEGSVHGPRMKDMQDSPVTSLHLMPLTAAAPRKHGSYFADSGSIAGSSRPLNSSTPMFGMQSLFATQSTLAPSTPLRTSPSLVTTHSTEVCTSEAPSTPTAPQRESQAHSTSSAVSPAISSANILDKMRRSVYGAHDVIPTPFGPRMLVYMDWAASGRLLKPLEDYMAKAVYPHYANVHSEVGHCAGVTGGLVVNARDSVLEFCGAMEGYSVIFGGSGMTGAVSKLAHLLGIQRCDKGFKMRKQQPTSTHQDQHDGNLPVVFFSSLEHHSNCVFWREMDCISVCICEDANGLPDQAELEKQLQRHLNAPLLLGTFTAGSNVTGIMPDVHGLARLMHKYRGYAVFDYASAASSCVINCSDGLAPEDRLDAVMLSPHKFPGGPGTTGALVIRDDIIKELRPQVAGGGCVLYVTPRTHEYLSDVEYRETAGTPNILGIIRTGLCLQLQMNLGIERMHAISHAYTMRAINVWRLCPGLRIVGVDRPAYRSDRRMPIVSFNIFVRRFAIKPGDRIGTMSPRPPASSSSNPYGSLDDDGELSDTVWLHPLFVTQVLNDVYGIQSRGGCACAGPYGAALLEDWIREACGMDVDALMRFLEPGRSEGIRPGWCRVYFSHLMTPDEVDYVIRAVLEVATMGWKLLPLYDVECASGTFTHVCARPHSTKNRLATAVQQMLSQTPSFASPRIGGFTPRNPDASTAPARTKPLRSTRTSRLFSCMAPSPGLHASGRSRWFQKSGGTTDTEEIRKGDRQASLSRPEEVKMRLDEQMAEAEHIYREAKDAVSSCRPLNAQWESDVHACESRYFDFMHSRARWFMLPHEAAAAIRAGEDLSWMSYYNGTGSRSGKGRA